jgi:glycosyltransferase involved in cell wall biosynthesis
MSAGTANRSGEVVFIAHDVGGPGGMERQSGHLVLGLLEAGRPVTVIARSCALGEREGLRFVRVAVPRRPATLAYPAFFLVASVLAARHRGALLHTTGAIVGNRADVSSVHYCHRAAAARVAGSRARRSSRLYHLNSAVAARLSRAGEWWCYRPGRTRLLSAVSEGVASELREQFPRMAARVRTVPNGVDSSVFRPDPAVRPGLRCELGIDDRAPLALFVGGDWGRKGLRYAVDALTSAPGWHLAIAGDGDRDELSARARASGTETRLHFLGSVGDMAPVYAAADAFVLPTAYEAFPLVTLEAAASGLPLLVTRVNGVEDLLHEGRNGWFVSPEGRDIARRLNELTADGALARRMSAEARTAATGFSWEAMTAGYLSIYAERLNAT